MENSQSVAIQRFRNRMRKQVLWISVLILIPGLLAAGCNRHGGSDSDDPLSEATGKMATFKSEDELESYLLDQFAGSLLPEDLYGGTGDEDSATNADPSSDFDTASDAGSSGGSGEESSFSGTNLQEAGVDESDKVKTDGTHFYIAREQTVSIAKVVPQDAMSLIATIDVPGLINSLYLADQILAILHTPFEGEGESSACPIDQVSDAMIGIPCWVPVRARTGVLFADVSDPENPLIIKDFVMDGWYVSSRRIDENLHLIQQFIPELPPMQYWYDGTEEDRQAVMEENERALEELTLNDLVPMYEIHDTEGQVVQAGHLVEPDGFYRPSDDAGGSIVTVTSFDLSNPEISFESMGVVANVQVIYASTTSLYLTASRWIASTSTDGLATLSVDSREYTVIHKLNLSGDHVEPLGSGAVPGWILNQFSLGEYEEVLRVATTTGEVWSSDHPARNHVYTLKIQDVGLNIIGRLEDLAPGETIYSARFIGTRGFLVTFVKVDPLFTIDLSDPTNPLLVGELKVPGYSDYIHPMDENHLMTIGKDAKEEGGFTYYQGVQLSIFDITDFSNPQLLYKQLIGDRGTESEALHNHKAFTFWPEKGLLAIPIELNENRDEPQSASQFAPSTFIGLYVYRVTEDSGFEFLGRISTGQSDIDSFYYYPRWIRGIFIDDSVYAVTMNEVRSAKNEDVENSITTLNLTDHMPFSTIQQGTISGINEERLGVIRDQTLWDEYWKEHDVWSFSSVPKSPTVDFQNDMVIVAHLGTRASGGYSAQITNIKSEGEELLVYYIEFQPGSTCVVTQEITHPFHSIKLRKLDQEASFIKDITVRECPRD